jgi:small GTP-binding protein
MPEIRKKIVLFGNVGVGKTSISRQFLFNEFSKVYLSTMGVQVDKKIIQIGEYDIILMIWDLAGEIFETKLYDNYVKGAHGIIGVFDATRMDTLSIVKDYFDSLREQNSTLSTIIVANKIDLLSEDELINIENLPQIDFLTSAKTGYGIEKAFYSIAETMMSYV